MADTNDLLNFAVNKNPVEFQDTFDAIMRQKAVAAIESHRTTLAQSIYADQPEDQFQPEYDEDDLDDLDVDIDEIEDLDLDDVDLDDLDDLDNIDVADEDFTDEAD